MQQEIAIFKQAMAKSDYNPSARSAGVSLPGPKVVNAMPTSSNLDHIQSSREREVLAEIFELLEEYGPSWYTEEHHTRIVAALKIR